MSICDENCVGCVYSAHVCGGGLCCDYFLIRREQRGCPAGAGCSRRTLGLKKQQSPDEAFFCLPPAAGRRELPPPKPEPEPKPGPKPEPKPEPEPVKKYPELEGLSREQKQRVYVRAHMERLRAELQGRQRAAILAFCAAENIKRRALAERVGVTEGILNKWASEQIRADWTKLGAVGIIKPEGLP